MKHRTKTPGSVFRIALLVGLASLGVVRSARASWDYPPALAAAIASQYPMAVKCVPLCTACHLTTQGGPGNLNVFGVNMENVGGLLPGDASLVGPALAKLAKVDPDSDGDGTHDIEEIEAGDSPSVALPLGIGEFCPDIKYGCGARIAPAPPVDRFSLFTAGLVVFGLAAARRRRAALRAKRGQR
jgi:hypothetical protein